MEIAISEKLSSYLDDEFLIEDQILTPKSSLRELQHRMNVGNDFNARIKGLSQGKDVRTHFQYSGGSCLNVDHPSIANIVNHFEMHYVHPDVRIASNVINSPPCLD